MIKHLSLLYWMIYSSYVAAYSISDNTDCSANLNCTSCARVYGCSWCDQSSTCVVTGPLSDACGALNATCTIIVNEISENKTAKTLALASYILLALAVPISLFAGYVWYNRIIHRHKQQKVASKAAFSLGLTKLGEKYAKVVQRQGLSNIKPDSIFESDFRSSSKSKKGFSKLLG